MTVILKPLKVIHLRPVNRAVLLTAAAGLALLAAVLPLTPEARSGIGVLAAACTYLLLLAAILLVPLWRQRIEVNATHIAVTPAYGRRRTVVRSAIVRSTVYVGPYYDMAGRRYLDFFGDSSAAPPLLSIVLDVYRPSDQAFLLALAREITGRDASAAPRG
jgi:hypothetical protein